MRWWHGAFTSSSSSAKPQQQHSYDDSVIRYNSVKPSFFSSSRRDRQFHRGRRLRRLFRSPSHYENSSATSPSPSHSSVSPQPLPLPELHVLLRRDPNFVKSSSPSVPLPSPGDTVQTRGGAEEKERDRIEKASNAEAVDGWVKRLTGEERRRNVERSESRSSSRKSPRKKNAKERSQRSYNINIPISAPTSPYSSPILSPPRSDMLATQSSTPPGVFQVWSAPEMPHSDRNIGFGFYYQSPYDRNESSLDNSPLHSPRGSNNMFAASPPRPASPVTARIPLENPLARWESNAQATVHPLPLPPGAVVFSQPGPISPVSDFSGGSVPSQRSSVSTPPPISPVSDFSGASVPSQFPQMSSRDVCEFPGANIPSQSAPISQNASKPEVMPIKSQWQKGKLIGRGTFGSVYVASNRETGALCAMKEVEILPDDSKSAECMRQLEQEIKVLSRLKHPNIVQYYGSEIVGDRFYIYLEYVHPGSINKFIQDHCGAITESVVRNFTRHILSGLAYLHRKKTIHRDIKGANLLVDAYGVVKLADFGMAKHLNGQAANLSLKGSPYWLAPELLQSVMQKDASSDVALAVDIWSLGCTIIEMMNGKPPWSEYEGAAALFKVLQESPPIPETLSADGKDFLECCFRRNPADRPTASKLLDHPFLNYSQHVDSCAESLNEMQLSGNKQSRRQGRNHKLEQIPSSFDTKSKKGNRGSNEISQQNLGQAPRLTVAPIPSPRSTLEVLPTLSPPSSGMDII